MVNIVTIFQISVEKTFVQSRIPLKEMRSTAAHVLVHLLLHQAWQRSIMFMMSMKIMMDHSNVKEYLFTVCPQTSLQVKMKTAKLPKVQPPSTLLDND